MPKMVIAARYAPNNPMVRRSVLNNALACVIFPNEVRAYWVPASLNPLHHRFEWLHDLNPLVKNGEFLTFF